MPGLLDFGGDQPGGLLGGLFSDPGARLGLSLLAASSPKLRGLGDVMAQQDQAQKQALQQQYVQSQIDENKSQAKMREQQLTMAQQKQNMISNLFGGGGPLAGVTTGGGINVPASGGGLQNMTLDDVALLKANGIDVSDIWKLGREGFKRDAGAYYESVNGDTRYMPKFDNGMVVSNGQVVQAPGYAQANAGIKGAETDAIEAAKYPYTVGVENAKANIGSANDLVTLNLASGPVQVTRAQALAMTQGQQPQAQGPQIGGGQNLTPQLRELIAQDAAANGIANPVTNFQGAGRGQAYGVTNASPMGFGIPLQSDAEKARAVETAKADVVRDTSRQSDNKRYGQLTAGIDRAIELLNQSPTASGVGAVVDKGLGAVGASTRGSVAASQLETLSGWLVSNVPRMEGPQSNLDVQNYQMMAGMVGDRTKPVAQRIAAAQEVKKLQEKYAALNGGDAQQNQQPARREFSMLPNANEYANKRMQGPDGSIYRSTGGKWVKE